jgi:hypothetical protein
MATQIYVNLPVRNLDRSIEFFTALGYTFNPQFTDKNATCMVVSDSIYVMLLVEPFFKTFTPKPIADARSATEVILAVSCESKGEVDEMVRKAVAAGATTPMPAQDHGFMYQHGYQDLDGHLWELVYMEPGAEARA